MNSASWQLQRQTFRRLPLRSAALLPAVFCTLMLTGCVSSVEKLTGSQASASAHAPPTVETDVRRRARIRLELAANYFQMGQSRVALDEVNQALGADPSYLDALILRGLILMEQSEWAGAEESFRRAMAVNPQDPNVLHNYGWLQCQQGRFLPAQPWFDRALERPGYGDKGKTWMAKGICFLRAGQLEHAEAALFKAYELDALNPVVGYNLSLVLFRRSEFKRAQFYIRRLNNTQRANAESLWLGIKIERALQDMVAMRQLADQLNRRFPESREWLAYERGAFND